MALKTSTFISKGYVVPKGHTHLRVPNLTPNEIWQSIKAYTHDERKSLIAVLAGIKHPAARNLERMNELSLRHQSVAIRLP